MTDEGLSRDIEEQPSEIDQRMNSEFENGDLTEKEIPSITVENEADLALTEEPLPERTAVDIEGPSALYRTEKGMPKDHHPWRESYERELFVDLLGYDYDRQQIDVPGLFELNLEDGEVKIQYTVHKRTDLLDQDRPSSFLEYFVDQGIVENQETGENYNINLEMGKNPYIELEMTYDETSNKGRKKAIQKMEVIKDLLGGDQ